MSVVKSIASIPVVDYRNSDAARQFTDSLHETGFAVLSHHPIDLNLINQAYEEWKAFFNSDDKHNYPFDTKEHDGFASFELSETAKGNDKKDLKEFYHWYTWGRSPAYLSATTGKLFAELNKLAEELLSWVEKSMPQEIRDQLSIPLSEMIQDSPRTLFRPIYYPALTGAEQEGAVRAAEHEDIDLLTVLAAATEKGLQVRDKNGNWIEVPTDPNWLIINTGDMLAECTQSYYKATTHRVVNPEAAAQGKARMSMPLFLHPREDVRLSQRHTAGSYRQERFKELGLL